MNLIAEVQNKYQDSYLTAYQANQLPWLQTLRQSHFNQFLSDGFPTKKLEQWKYTDASVLGKTLFLPTNNIEGQFEIKSAFNQACQLVFMNGKFDAEKSQLESLNDGVIVTHLQQALKQYPDLVKEYLLKAAENTSSLVDLNTALMVDGAFIYIPKNIIMEFPIEIVHVTQHSQQHLRHIIIVDENSELTLLERYQSVADDQYFNNSVTQIYLNHDARMSYSKCQNESNRAYHFASINVVQEKGSSFSSQQILLGGKMAREDLSVKLNGEAAGCRLVGLYVLAPQQHIDNHTYVHHNASRTYSQENYKGILAEDSTAVFNGKVIVKPQLHQVEAQQSNKNILLAKSAEVNTKPELEIYSNDVKCSHGATVGQIDEAALFYLQSRGIDKENAEKLLTYAFAGEVLDCFSDQNLKQYINSHLKAKLEHQI